MTEDPAVGERSRAFRAGVEAYRERRFADAVRVFAQLVAEDGTDGAAWQHLGNARWRRGDRDGAIEAYRRAVGESPEHARAWHNLSTALLAAGRYREAADAAEHAAALGPKRGKAWNNLAAARHALGDGTGAETALRRALEADTGFAVARSNLGRLLLDAGRVAEAREMLHRAVTDGACDPETVVALARSVEAGGDSDGAEAILADGVRASPSSVDLWRALGDRRRARGALEPALDAYEAAAAAAADMGAAERESISLRRTVAALGCAAGRVEEGDGTGFVAFVTRVREALSDGGASVATHAEVTEARSRCVLAAGTSSLSASWVGEVLSGALRAPAPARGTNGVARH